MYYSSPKSHLTSSKPQHLVLLLIVCSFVLLSCEDERVQTVSWTEFEPVYLSEAEFIGSVEMLPAQDLQEPGKIYFYNQYLFVNEVNKGVHVIDNSDPSSPLNIGFINIPANKDIAVRGSYLYADSNTDLLVFDIQNLQNPQLVSRLQEVFTTWSDIYLGFPYQEVDPSKGIVVDWKEVVITETCESEDCYIYNPRFGIWGALSSSSAGFAFEGSGGGTNTTSGIGGSMARFAISDDYLYAVDETNLITLEISSPEPAISKTESIGWRIETIFPYQNNLFIGSQSAMYIYSIENKASPTLSSVYNHLTSCDPVVVQGDFAYVTLREGDICPRGVNRLEVIDIQDISNPQEIATYDMQSPHGLGIDGDYLFVSEGELGLKIMDATDPLDIKLLRFITDIKTFDVIPFNNVLMVTGGSGITQYDYSDIDNIELLSIIPVVEIVE